jgi:hypothetical protein
MFMLDESEIKELAQFFFIEKDYETRSQILDILNYMHENDLSEVSLSYVILATSFAAPKPALR